MMLVGTTYGDQAELESTSVGTGIEEDPPLLELHREIRILGEVVGAYGLIRDEADTEDDQEDQHIQPYAIVKYDGQVIQQTGTSVEAGRNPLWTISSRSLFMFSATPYHLMKKHLEVSLWFNRKDALNISTLEKVFLGRTSLNGDQIISNCNEQRVVVDLMDDFEDNGLGNRGKMTMRFRLATDSDEEFLRTMTRRYEMGNQSSFSGVYNALAAKGGNQSLETNETAEVDDEKKVRNKIEERPVAFIPTEQDETQVAGESFIKGLSSAFTSKSYFDKDAGTKKIKTKPHPDPDRVEETSYMSAVDIKRETMAPSKEWVEAGSGNLGKLYLEILCCEDLPNVDVGESVGNLTDAFVCVVYEDSMVQTPVIDDELSPHWLSWTQRAFVFRMMHPASMLYLGCFDYDLGPLTDHENIGRVAVNISNLQRDTDYTLTYNLYPSSNVTERKANGSITIRLRVEYFNEKEAVLAALKPRPKFHVNVQREKSLKVVHYTCFGEYGDENEEKFDLTVTRSYISEIFEHKRNLSYAIGDGVRSLIFWRGQVRVLGLMLPLHSFLFFFAASTLVERPYLLPSFTLISIAWIMMATGTQRQQHPSPWYRCPSFWQYVEVLKTGRSSLRIRRIKSKEGFKATEAYETDWNNRMAKDLDEANRRAEMMKQLNDLGNEKIQTKMVAENMIPIELLGKLARWQGIIGRYCGYFRFIKIILTWEESIVSFWITACFLVAGLVSLILPWAFLLTWISRLVVWCCLGPHMMIVDAYLNSGKGDDKVLEKAMENFNQQGFNARSRYQEALKLKDMKCLRFGQYITLVPNYNLARYYDRPLATSFARLHKAGPIKIARHRVPGQQFFGHIIPRTQEENEAFITESAGNETLLEHLVQSVKAYRQHEADEELRSFEKVPGKLHTIHYERVSQSTSDELDEEVKAIVATDPARVSLSSSASMQLDETGQVAVLSFRDSRFLSASTVKIGYELVELAELDDDDKSLDGMPSEKMLMKDEVARKSVVFERPSSRQSVSDLLKDPVAALAKNMEDSWGMPVAKDDMGGPEADEDGVEVVLGRIDEADESVCSHVEEKKDDDYEAECSTIVVQSTPRQSPVHVVLYRQGR
eukprot:scaffold2069_cov187-Amphora_coffeaeformis.AAC.5